MHVAVWGGGTNPDEHAIARIQRYLVVRAPGGQRRGLFIHCTWENVRAAIRHWGGIMGGMLLCSSSIFHCSEILLNPCANVRT